MNLALLIEDKLNRFQGKYTNSCQKFIQGNGDYNNTFRPQPSYDPQPSKGEARIWLYPGQILYTPAKVELFWIVKGQIKFRLHF